MRLRRPSTGTLIALVFAAILVLGLVFAAAYKAHEARLPPVAVTFHRLQDAPANATVHTLDFRAVHDRDPFLEDHLDTARQHGLSREAQRLRVERMHETLQALTGSGGPLLLVQWQDTVVQVTFSGLP
ncbi:MAG TPA: hypothetical protein VHI93_05095 [Candidatus Thermoplasmatota archaeon]|nr:hypothetical protein [Candidatus Thermoplasmatota archaeon]